MIDLPESSSRCTSVPACRDCGNIIRIPACVELSDAAYTMPELPAGTSVPPVILKVPS